MNYGMNDYCKARGKRFKVCLMALTELGLHVDKVSGTKLLELSL